jgi:hypothetical protein
MKRATIVVSLASLALGACQGAHPGHATAQLVSLSGGPAALDFVRQVEIERMNQQIDDQIARFDSGDSCDSRKFAEGDSASANGVAPPAAPSPAPTTGGHTTAPTDPTATAMTASGTNNQVVGVDEADFVKNDTKYVYLAQNGVLRVIDGWPAESAHEIARVALDGEPRKMFVAGDRALVYVAVPDPRRSGSGSGNGGGPSYGGGHECTYGYQCSFAGDGTSTKLELFDLSDKTQPKKLRELFVSGSLIAARRIGSAVHTVVADNLQLFPEVQTYVSVDLCDYQAADPTGGFSYSPTPLMPPSSAVAKAHGAFEALREKNRQIILNKNLAGVLPSMADSISGPNALSAPSPLVSGFYRAQLLDGASFTTLLSLDMSADTAPTTATIVSSPGAVYASAEALYMAVPSEQSYGGIWYDGYAQAKQASSVHKFRISDKPADTAYLGSGLIKGRVLNQFAMDEKDGALRVASTNGYVPDPEVDSQLTVLAPDEESGGLSQLGSVEHLGPKEDIRAVRFEGDQAFVVTFKKTDPLWVIDLSNPSQPRVTGELQIPGFSTYIHKLDDTHLLSIGYDANDHDSFAFFDGVLLQIFDIADPANPALVQRYKIGTRGTSSDALTDHLAFNYFAPLKMLAVPMTICEGGGDGTFGDTLAFTGLMLFDIDAQTGIVEHGRVPYPKPSLDSASGTTNSCSNWWTNASSDVKRSIFMDRYVYAISDELLKVESIDALGTDLQSIDLMSGP